MKFDLEDFHNYLNNVSPIYFKNDINILLFIFIHSGFCYISILKINGLIWYFYNK